MSADYQLGSTIYIPFTTRAFATGIPTALVSGVVDIYEDATATPIVTNVLGLTVSLGTQPGFNMVEVVTVATSGFELGKNYTLLLDAGTVDSVSVVSEVIGQFSLDKSAAAEDLANVTDGLGVLKAETAAIVADTGTDGVVLAPDAITAAKIADNAIATEHIATGAISADSLATDTITAAKIEANAIGATELATDAIGDAQIATGAIASTAFAAGAIDAAAIAANAITSSEFADGTITAAKFAAGAIDAAAIATDAIDADALAADAVNEIARAIGVQTNTALSDIEFFMSLSSDHVSPATGLTVTGERSIDAAAFTGVSGTITEVSDGIYQFDADAADLNGSLITFRFSSGTADDTFLTIKTVT